LEDAATDDVVRHAPLRDVKIELSRISEKLYVVSGMIEEAPVLECGGCIRRILQLPHACRM